MIEAENMILSAGFVGLIYFRFILEIETTQIVMKKTGHQPMPFHGFNIV